MNKNEIDTSWRRDKIFPDNALLKEREGFEVRC